MSKALAVAAPQALAVAASQRLWREPLAAPPLATLSAKCVHSGHWEGLWVIFIECLAYSAHTITPNADHVTFRLTPNP